MKRTWSGLSEQMSSLYRVSENEHWNTLGTARLKTSRLRWFGQVEYSSLDSGKLEQRVRIEFQAGRHQSVYDNLVTGTVTDLYNEELQIPYQTLRVSYDATLAWKRRRAFTWNSTVFFNEAEPSTDLRSGRFNNYFQLDPGENRLRQDIQFDRLVLQNKAELYQRTNKTDLRFAIKINHQSQRINSELVEEQDPGSSPDIIATSKTRTFRSIVSLAGSAEYNFNKQYRIGLSGSSSLFSYPVSSGIGLSAGYRIVVAAIRTLSIFRRFSISGDLSRSLPEPAEIYDGPIISGGYSILYGLRHARPVEQFTCSAAYLDANLFRGRSFNLLANVSITDHGLISLIDLEPDVGVSFSLQQFRSFHANLSCNYERHVESMKGKFTGRFAGNMVETPLILNAVTSITRTYTYSAEIMYQPDLKKLHVELTGRLDHYYTTLERIGEGSLQHKNYRVSTHARVRARLSERLKTFAEYHFYRMARHAYFDPLDLSLFFRISQRIQLSLVVHNLMNRKSIVATQISGYSRQVSGYGIIPRYFMVGLSFDL